jgi:hypothetical protein
MQGCVESRAVAPHHGDSTGRGTRIRFAFRAVPPPGPRQRCFEPLQRAPTSPAQPNSLTLNCTGPGPFFKDVDFLDFYNLELADTNVVDHNTHK